jgi:hypothetical protein
MYPITNKTRSFHGSQFENGCQRLGNPESESKQHTTENKMESAMLVAFRPAAMKYMDGSPRYASNHDELVERRTNLPYICLPKSIHKRPIPLRHTTVETLIHTTVETV